MRIRPLRGRIGQKWVIDVTLGTLLVEGVFVRRIERRTGPGQERTLMVTFRFAWKRTLEGCDRLFDLPVHDSILLRSSSD